MDFDMILNYEHVLPLTSTAFLTEQLRKVIYTTNAVESANSQLRKVTKNKRVFPNDNAVFKTLYLAIDYMTKKWTMSIPNWNAAIVPQRLRDFTLAFEMAKDMMPSPLTPRLTFQLFKSFEYILAYSSNRGRQ